MSEAPQKLVHMTEKLINQIGVLRVLPSNLKDRVVKLLVQFAERWHRHASKNDERVNALKARVQELERTQLDWHVENDVH